MKNEAFLNGLLGVIKQPVFAKNENFLYTYCNQAFADYLGKTVHEIIGHNVFQLFTAENAEIYHQSDQQLFESGGTQQYETIISSLDGTEHHSIIYKNIITDDKDSKIGIIGLIEDVTELKEKEKKLYETESKYKKFFENVQDIFYQIDLNGIITDISPSVSKYSDYTRKEIIGQPIDLFYANPEDRNNLLIEIQKKGEALDFEVQLKGKNNRLTFASVNAHFICDENGQVSGLEGSLRDLTERKLAEGKLKLSLSLLQATLDSTTDGILVVDTSGKITSYNNQFKAIFDVPEEILESGNDTIALESVLNKLKDPNQFINKVQLLYQHPEMDSFDAIEFSDGRIIERFSCPQRLDGKPIGRVWNFRDVSVREKAGQQLQLMAHTLESINECISITDTEDRILFINEAFLKTYGFSQEELIGQHISIVRSPNNDPEIINKIIKVTANTGWKGEILNRRKDGSDFPISLSTSVVQNEKGEILGMVGVAIDVSERKKEELELKESEERYRSFFEGSPDAIFLADLETGILIDANPAASILLKKPLSEIIGMHHTNLHPKSAEDFSRKSLQSVSIREQQKSLRKPTENLVVCSNGTEVPVEIMANTIHIKGRSVIQGIFRDISERKLAESAIHESEKRFRLLIETQGEGVSI
ncbi:MAG TPA: PAS domain-containing protein, partial [Prolixibacteraceae bacterium]